MVMPEDPVMLLSFVNMKLRDFMGVWMRCARSAAWIRPGLWKN